MSLRNTGTLDVIVDSPHTPGYDLIIYDGGDVPDDDERYSLLMKKIEAYAERHKLKL
jgi:hypothetical protein